MNRTALSADRLDQLAKAAVTPDENRLLARRNLYRSVKQPVTMRLDADVLPWFRGHSAGGGYQTEINRVLREYVTGSGRRA